MSYNAYNLIIANTKDNILLNQIFKELKKQYTNNACDFQMKNDAIYFTGKIRASSVYGPPAINDSYLDTENYSYLTTQVFSKLYGKNTPPLTHHLITILDGIEEYADGDYFNYMTYYPQILEWESSLKLITT